MQSNPSAEIADGLQKLQVSGEVVISSLTDASTSTDLEALQADVSSILFLLCSVRVALSLAA